MDGRLCIWDLNTFGLRHVCQHGAGVVELQWMRDSALLVTCTVSRELRVYDARDGSCARRMIGHHDAVLCVELVTSPSPSPTPNPSPNPYPHPPPLPLTRATRPTAPMSSVGRTTAPRACGTST